MVVVGKRKTKVRQQLSPTPKHLANKKSGVRNSLIWIIVSISFLLLVICMLGFLQGDNKDNKTDLPRLVRDYLINSYEVSRDKIGLIISWTNRIEDVTETNGWQAVDDDTGDVKESEEEDLYEYWARYDEELKERWTKFVEN